MHTMLQFIAPIYKRFLKKMLGVTNNDQNLLVRLAGFNFLKLFGVGTYIIIMFTQIIPQIYKTRY